MPTPHRAVFSAVAKDYTNRLIVDDGDVEPAIPAIVCFTIPDAASGDVDIVLATKFEVTDIVCVKRNGAGAGNTVTIKSTATAISNAIACDTDDAVTRAGSIIDGAGTNVIPAGGTLRATCTRAAGTRNSQIFVHGLIRP